MVIPRTFRTSLRPETGLKWIVLSWITGQPMPSVMAMEAAARTFFCKAGFGLGSGIRCSLIDISGFVSSFPADPQKSAGISNPNVFVSVERDKVAQFGSERFRKAVFSLLFVNSFAFSSKTPFTDPNPSRWAGATLVIRPWVGSAIFTRNSMSPGWLAPISRMDTVCSRVNVRSVRGRPIEVLKLPVVA